MGAFSNPSGARTAAEWGAVLPQWLGMLALLLQLVFWMATGKVEPFLLTAFGGLIFVGQAGEAVVALRKLPSESPSPAVSDTVVSVENGP